MDVIICPTCLFQVAERQGRYLAKQLANIHSGRQPDPFVYKPWGMLAYIGGYKALTDTPVAKSQGKHCLEQVIFLMFTGRFIGIITIVCFL